MGKFTVIPQNTFEALQLDAGVLLWNLDPLTGEFTDDDIICATTGGISVSCVPTYEDLGADVDNVPTAMKELQKLSGWTCTISTTSLGTSAGLIKLALGAADIEDLADGKYSIKPRADLKQTDFRDILWAGDKANGGAVVVKLLNALSTGGFTLKTSKNGKGQISITITGHVSIAAQKEVPMKFYSVDAEGVTYTITNTLTNVTNSNTATSIAENETYTGTLTADTGYTIDTVTVSMGGVNVTDTVYTAATGAISIPNVTGNVIITATATEE